MYMKKTRHRIATHSTAHPILSRASEACVWMPHYNCSSVLSLLDVGCRCECTDWPQCLRGSSDGVRSRNEIANLWLISHAKTTHSLAPPGYHWACKSLPIGIIASVSWSVSVCVCVAVHVGLHDNTYSLRPRRHDLMLSRGSYCLTDCNFIIRQIFKESYWIIHWLPAIIFHLCRSCVLTASLLK